MRGTIKATFKRLLGIVAAVAMVLGMSGVSAVPVMAASNLTITVNNAQPGQTYTLYKLFNATVNTNRAGQTDNDAEKEVMTSGISYTLLDATHQLTANYGGQVGTTWFSLQADNIVKANDDVTSASLTSAAFRSWALAYGQKVGDAKTVSGSNPTSLEFTGLSDGYYFITSTMRSLVTVTSVAPNAVVKDKNSAPAVEKTESVVTSSVGDTVTYTIEISIPKNSTKVIFHDKLGRGLDLADNLTSLTEGDPGKSLTKDTDYTVDYWNSTDYGSGTTNSTSKTDDNITISFTSTYLNSLNDRVTIYLRYNATLNSDADVNMPNEAYVIYGDNNTESTHKTVYESTFGFQINKVDSDNNNSPLNGAKFVLSKDGNLTGLSETSSGDNLLSFDSTGTYTTSNGQKVREANNTLIYKGLNDNENNTAQIIYYLYEVKAPDGYFELTGPIAIKIEPKFNTTETTKVDSYTISYKLPTASDYVTISETQVGHIHAFNVPNSQSIALPSTGGIGTTIFYIIGGVLVAGAVVLLIMRQRRKA